MRRGRCFPIPILGMLAALLAVSGCSDDNATKPKAVTIADFEGTWDVTRYRVTHKTIPQMTVDFIEQGASLYFVTSVTGQFTGEMQAYVEELQQEVTLPFTGSLVLVDQQTVTVAFDSEIEPYLTGFTGSFTIDGDIITLVDENATFDFDDDGSEEPVTAEIDLVRR